MKHARHVHIVAFFLCASAGIAQVTEKPTEVKTLKDLVSVIAKREKAVKSVSLSMKTRGSLPGNATFESTGTLRVLGTTHFHTAMKTDLGNGLTSEFETVKTPEGVWMRESDPAQGEVFVKMDQKTLTDLESASQAIGDSGMLGAGADMANGPLGSVMLDDLGKQFELAVSGPKVVAGQECWTVSGDRRKDAGEQVAFETADRVEILVRRADFAVVRMTQLSAGRPIVDIEVTSIEVDKPIEEATFKLELPAKARFIDVKEHPPARAQIDRIFAEAEAKGWKRSGDATAKPVEDDGKASDKDPATGR